jgi:hypothetical protein
MRNTSTEPQPDKYRDHAQVWELLPWFINGTASTEEKQRIAAHAAVCLTCRKELAAQAALRDSVKHQELDELVMAASFDRLSAKLQQQDAPRRHIRSRYAMAATLALAAILTGATAKLLLGNNTFKTLSNPLAAAPAANLHLIFVDGIPDAEREAILNAAGLRIVSGPDERGLYALNADNASPEALQALLTQLHRDFKILFVELAAPASADSPPSGAQ